MSKDSENCEVREYLNSLTKEELRDLFFELAPESFFNRISNKLISKHEALVQFNETSESINELFSNDILLCNPKEFRSELLELLEELRGLWGQLPREIGELIIRIIEQTEGAFEGGYLYKHSYRGEEEYFESEEVNEYIFRFAKGLPQEVRSDYQARLRGVLGQCSYGTFLDVERGLSEARNAEDE